MPTLYEYCNSGDNAVTQLVGISWKAQSFTPAIAHKITSVKLKLYRGGSPGTVIVSIRATDAYHYPIGDDLTSGSIDGNTLTTDTAGLWYEIALTEYQLSQGVKYAIVVRVPNATTGNYLYWRFNNTNPYAGGMMSYSANSGDTWGLNSANDLMFEDWGYVQTYDYIETGLTQVILADQGESDAAAQNESSKLQEILVVIFAVQEGEYIETALTQIILAAQGQTDNAALKESSKLQVILTVVGVSDYTADGDWNLFVTGKDSAGNFKLWSLIYGDGGDVDVGTWSALKEFASAALGEGFQYHRASISKPDVYRAFYIEKFTGSEAYNRPFWSHSVSPTFLSSLWREPVPFNLSSEYGLAIAHHGAYCWLSSPNGVWRAPLTVQTLDLTSDVVSARIEQEPKRSKLTIELRNDDGRYSTLPSPLAIGCQLDFSPGYVTTAGNEVSPGQTFILEAYEHTSGGGKATLILQALDGWGAINAFRARHQFRWNKATNELNTRDILAFVLARVGLQLVIASQSEAISGYYPDFTINPNNRGDLIISRLLSFVPDVLFIEGNTAYLVNPLSNDASVYSYVTPQSADHVILEARYQVGAWELNRIQVEGDAVIADSFAWGEISKLYDRFQQLYDRNLTTVAKAQERGQAYLREAELSSANGIIRIPTNCGQQLYDVIAITDSRAGLSAEKKRVLGLTLVYNPAKAQYEHRLALGKV